VLLVVVAAIGAIGVFFAVSAYVRDVRRDVGPKITVYRLTSPVAAHAPLLQSDVRASRIPERWAPPTALRSRTEMVSLVAATNLEPGSLIQKGMLEPPPELEEGQRELAIVVDAETGVAGKIAPSDLVDIDATFGGDQTRGTPDRSITVVSGARILDIGQPARGDQVSTQPGVDPASVVPVTFALTPRQALSVTYAESFAEEVRLALLRAGETVQGRTPREYRLPPRLSPTTRVSKRSRGTKRSSKRSRRK